ncbi:MAG: TonB-dependent receptor [Salibacteraceae bacterium]|nr:TonB-dependent receptor [Salibacteraceae bacterium]MDP4687673.1 TonB-dependent receptor [Salibacteraceae bacterium]MDP4763411.1 TonB-dependent receptor [Salibacteraceae bacterium]MDP4845222.1 TonB-dependent receptor [Salibacteraceae bacterium]MDP4965260.1 TonB-dependent receptor [Salibacteraceae bacterium]
MLKTTLISLCISLISWGLYAQTTTVSGVVSDENGMTIPGVNVVEKGTTNGTTTDMDGKYTISASKSENLILSFSFLGFETSEIAAVGRSNINVVMKPSVAALDEVVVVGYGTSTKKEVTGATAKVQGESLQKLNIPRMDQALQGQVSGVAINTNSGSPGGSSSIRIRGLSTFGDNDPLILVDGVVYDSEGLNSLNPNDIASINVLKDATAGIYGVRAANGVILIETKKGSTNSAPQFEVSSYYGIQNAANKLGLLNAQEYAVIKNEAFANGNDDAPFANTALGEGTNWQDSVLQSAAVMNFNVGVTGGSKNTTYSIGGSYFSQDGIVGGPKSNFTRFNGRVNLNTDLSEKLKLSSVFLYTNEERNILPENGIGSVLYNTINAFPTDPIRTSDGNYSYLEEVSDIINPIAQMENTHNTAWVNKFVGKEELAYQINDDFTFTNRFSYNWALVDAKVFSPLVWYGPGKAQNNALNANLDPNLVEIADSTFLERGASVYEGRSTYVDVTFESFVNYKHVFNKDHTVKSTLGVSVFDRHGEGLGATAYNIPNNSIEYADISANLASGGFLNNASSFQYQERLLSTFMRAEYGFKSKYLVSAILRRDGSSKFGPNNRYGWFPTLSTAWVASEEDFFNVNAIEFLKVRASYGISGNDQIANFAYRALLDGEGVYVFDDIITTGVALGRSANPDLKWESTRQFNLGTDFTLFKKFDITANYFIKNTFDLLFQPDVSAVLGSYGAGSTPPVINAGDVSNKGFEFELAYSTDRNKKLVFNTNFNVTTLSNKVVRTPDGVDFLPGAGFGVGGNIATRFEAGYPIGYFHGYETAGVFQTQAEIDASPVTQAGAKPGDLIFVDQNGDNVINFSDDSDKTMIGSPIPAATFGLTLGLSYKGFDFSANVFAAVGQEIIRNFERQQPYANQLNYVINRWTGPESTNEDPRVTTGATRNTVFSDYYVENGSFMRLKNIQLGYTIPKSVVSKIKFSSIRVYVAANNLYTLTQYQGFDPEIGSAGGALASGVDYGFYPQARTIMGGISVKF